MTTAAAKHAWLALILPIFLSLPIGFATATRASAAPARSAHEHSPVAAATQSLSSSREFGNMKNCIEPDIVVGSIVDFWQDPPIEPFGSKGAEVKYELCIPGLNWGPVLHRNRPVLAGRILSVAPYQQVRPLVYTFKEHGWTATTRREPLYTFTVCIKDPFKQIELNCSTVTLRIRALQNEIKLEIPHDFDHSESLVDVQFNLYRNRQTGRCLDSNHQGAVYTNTCDRRNAYQQWEVHFFRPKWYAGKEIILMKNVATGRCLDSWDRRIMTLGCHAWRPQQFSVDYKRYRLGTTWRSFTGETSGMRLDSNDRGDVYGEPEHGNRNQEWHKIPR